MPELGDTKECGGKLVKLPKLDNWQNRNFNMPDTYKCEKCGTTTESHDVPNGWCERTLYYIGTWHDKNIDGFSCNFGLYLEGWSWEKDGMVIFLVRKVEHMAWKDRPSKATTGYQRLNH